MIIVKQDSELMTNLIPANPVPSGNRFSVFKDEQFNPAVMSLGDNHKLNLIIEIDGSPTLIDFGKTSGLVKDGTKILAFDVQQAPDMSLDICFALDAIMSQSDLIVIHAVMPAELSKPISSEKVATGHGFPVVHNIYMSNLRVKDPSSFPLIFLAFKRPDRIASEEDLGLVTSSTNGNGYDLTLDTSWRLATNPKRIIDVAFGTCQLGDGAFVLYESSVGNKLQFKVFRGAGVKFVAQPHCPDDAKCLTSFLDPANNHSVVLVGGQKIYSLTSKEYVSPKGVGTPITTNDKDLGLKDLHVAQAGEDLRVWYTTDSDAAHYYTCKTSALSNGRLVPLLKEGQGGQISSMLSLRSADGDDKQDSGVVSSLMSVDEHGNLMLLQQDSSTSVWQQYPFYHASLTDVMEVRGYTLRLQAVATDGDDDDTGTQPGSDQNLVHNCWLRVSSSGLVRCIINGNAGTLSPKSQWLQADSSGTVHVIMSTQDASCVKVFADSFRPSDESAAGDGDGVRPLDGGVLDPSKKIASKLENVQSEEDLRSATNPKTGAKLIPANASDDDLKKAAKAISILVKQMKDIDSSEQDKLLAMRSSFVSVKTGPSHSQFDIWDDIGDVGSEIWHWIEDKADDVIDWFSDVIETAAGKVLQFVITLAEDTYKILTDTISSIAKGISWIFKKLGVLFKDLLEFLGFLFHWDDILDATESIVTLFNVGLDYGEQALNNTETNVKDWLQKLKQDIKDQLPTIQTHNYDEIQEPANQRQIKRIMFGDNEGDAQKSDETKHGVGYNWPAYQIRYGGGATNAQLRNDNFDKSTAETLRELWDDIQDELETVEKTAYSLGTDFVDFFKDGKYDINALVAKISEDLIDGTMDSLIILSDILFKSVQLGIGMARDLANFVVDIPVISWLWSVITESRPGIGDLTLLNFCALMVAIPTTLLFKVVKMEAPPKLKGRLTTDTFGQYVNGQAVAGDSSLNGDLDNFNLAAAVGVATIAREVTAISLVASSVLNPTGFSAIKSHQRAIASSGKIPKATMLFNVPDWVNNVFDSGSLILEGVGLIFDWPLRFNDPSQPGLVTAFHWGAWLLELCNAGAIVVTRAVGALENIKRVETKRWRGTVAAVTCPFVFVMKLWINISDYTTRTQTTPTLIRHILEDMLELAAQCGFAIAAWNDEVWNEMFWVAFATWGICTGTGVGAKVYDFVEEQKE